MKNKNNSEKNSFKIVFIFLGAILGVGLLVYGSYVENSNEKNSVQSDVQVRGESMDADAYAREAEERIALLCSNIKGVSNVRVAVTLSGGYNAVYAQNSQSGSSGYKNEFVLTGSGSSEAPLLVGYSVPQISGVGIVCKGGGDANVRQEIISLVSATLGVSSNKIYVTESQN